MKSKAQGVLWEGVKTETFRNQTMGTSKAYCKVALLGLGDYEAGLGL